MTIRWRIFERFESLDCFHIPRVLIFHYVNRKTIPTPETSLLAVLVESAGQLQAKHFAQVVVPASKSHSLVLNIS
jgi:hypothetical protein